MSPRGKHCNNNNKNTKECQGAPGKQVGKQCEEYREGPVRTLVCSHALVLGVHENPLHLIAIFC